MRHAPETFGYRAMDYPIHAIAVDAAAEFLTAKKECDALSDAYERNGDDSVLPKMFEKRARMVRHGTVCLVMSVTLLDQVIYHYACSFLHHEDIEKLTCNMGLVRKWKEIPKRAKGLAIPDDHPAIKQLEDLVTARNAIVHPKVEWITTEHSINDLCDTEWPRFERVCSDVKSTFELCISLLK